MLLRSMVYRTLLKEQSTPRMPRTPLSTYRLQLHKDFTFDDAAAIADYLRDLGVSHVYSSPYLQASPGSMHGYDVVDHHRVNRELGGDAAHTRFCTKLGEMHLGQVLDIVPNHMSIHRDNRLWWDVLENGPSSRFASFFDVDWNSDEEKAARQGLAAGAGRPVRAGAEPRGADRGAGGDGFCDPVLRPEFSDVSTVDRVAAGPGRCAGTVGHAELCGGLVCATARAGRE